VPTSALTGGGIDRQRDAILRMAGLGGQQETGMLTGLRQHQAIAASLEALGAAAAALGSGTPHEMLLLDLYEALAGLDALTGQTAPDEALNLIFSTFCIGK
jgi:tRNA modification GTPase